MLDVLNCRQDSWFNYLFGVKEPGVYGAISLSTGKTTLFIPRLGPEYRIWCGEIRPPNHFKISYAVDDVHYTEDMKDWIAKVLGEEGAGAKLHVMTGTNSDSGSDAKPAHFEGSDTFAEHIDATVLYNVLAHCRVTKNEEEVEVMRYTANVASNAHAELMRSAKECSFEYELEAKFQYEIYRRGGCRKCAYTCIGACGPNAAVLHYGHAAAPNDRELQPTDMVSSKNFSCMRSTLHYFNIYFVCLSSNFDCNQLGAARYGSRVPRLRVRYHLLGKSELWLNLANNLFFHS